LKQTKNGSFEGNCEQKGKCHIGRQQETEKWKQFWLHWKMLATCNIKRNKNIQSTDENFIYSRRLLWKYIMFHPGEALK